VVIGDGAVAAAEDLERLQPQFVVAGEAAVREQRLRAGTEAEGVDQPIAHLDEHGHSLAGRRAAQSRSCRQFSPPGADAWNRSSILI
jgi:hypothetical protein